MISRFSGAAMALVLAGPAFALDFGPGFSLTGMLELEHYDSGDGHATFVIGDATLGWRSQGGGDLSFGFDLNPVALKMTRASGSNHEVWGGLVIGTGFGELTIGRPRPLLDGFTRARDIGEAWATEKGLSQLDGSYVAFFSMIPAAGLDTRGASFKGTAGSLSYGLAYHSGTVGLNDIDITEATLAWKRGAVEVYGGFERLAVGGGNIDKLIVGAEYSADRWAAGLEVVRQDGGTDSATGTKLFGSYEATDNITLSAQIRDLTDFGTEKMYGIGAEYRFGQGGYVQAGALDDGYGNAFSVSLGLRF